MNTTVTTKTISATNIQKDLNYIGIIEENNMRMIAGLSTYKNYEGKVVTKIMHVIIYNTLTKEIVYSTGNNLRMDIENLTQYAGDVMTVLNKHINDNDNFYLNKFMDMFFYDCNFMNIELMARQIRRDIHEEQIRIKTQQTAIERKQLENELYTKCKDKQILIINNLYTQFILVYSKQLATKQDSEDFKKLLYKIIDTDTISNYRELDNVKIKYLEYTGGNTLEANIYAIELLKRNIEYIGA
jgi:hypothetical protein